MEEGYVLRKLGKWAKTHSAVKSGTVAVDFPFDPAEEKAMKQPWPEALPLIARVAGLRFGLTGATLNRKSNAPAWVWTATYEILNEVIDL